MAFISSEFPKCRRCGERHWQADHEACAELLRGLLDDAEDRLSQTGAQRDSLLRWNEGLSMRLDRLVSLLWEGVENIQRVEGRLTREDGRYGMWVDDVVKTLNQKEVSP